MGKTEERQLFRGQRKISSVLDMINLKCLLETSWRCWPCRWNLNVGKRTILETLTLGVVSIWMFM